MPLLEERRLVGVAPGSRRFFEIQRRLIAERPLLREAYELWYRNLLSDEASVGGDPNAGVVLELGSGGSFLKQVCPRVLTSDIVPGVAESVIDARRLPFAGESVRAILMTHVFHHIPHVESFFEEAQRVLVPGGVIAMIEVPHTPLARLVFGRFHPEPYDDRAVRWDFEQTDSMLDSNQALSWIVFVRDRPVFERRYPDLMIEQIRYLPWLGYLLSGGVTRRNMAPTFAIPAVRMLDRLLQPAEALFSLHWSLTIRKRRESSRSASSAVRGRSD